ADRYIVSVDPKGVLGFHSGFIEKKGRPRAHVIEVLTSQVRAEYLGYLRNAGVSYIFAGEGYLDCKLLLEKLKEKFGIERLMVAGGGIMNASFLQDELIDELSLVVSPLADGNTTSASIFERSGFLPSRKTVAFSLSEAKPLDGDALWLRYRKKKTTKGTGSVTQL
ncbi:MAG: dihydrofolate reductase family protein, partial [Oliverpabstia sp.]